MSTPPGVCPWCGRLLHARMYAELRAAFGSVENDLRQQLDEAHQHIGALAAAADAMMPETTDFGQYYDGGGSYEIAIAARTTIDAARAWLRRDAKAQRNGWR